MRDRWVKSKEYLKVKILAAWAATMDFFGGW